MHSLTFRVLVTTPRSMDEMERRTQQARLFYRRRWESSPACVVRAACGGPGGLPLGSATHSWCCHSNATRAPIANPPNSAQLAGTPTIPPNYIWVSAVVWECGEGQTDAQTAVTDQYTFRLGCASREM